MTVTEFTVLNKNGQMIWNKVNGKAYSFKQTIELDK